MGARTSALRAVLGDRALLRTQLAFFAFNVTDWAAAMAVVVYAFGRGGVAEAGILSFALTLPSIFVAPWTASLGDRYPRARVLVGSYALQAILLALTAVALAADAAVPSYLLATAAVTALVITRPAQNALMPEIATSPAELTAANVAIGVNEGVGALVGPLLAGLLLALSGPAAVFVACAVGLGLGALASWPMIGALGTEGGPVAPAETAEEGATDGVGVDLDALLAGIRAVLGERRLRGLVLAIAITVTLAGALDVLYVVLAIDVLGLGEGGVGLLAAATGLGTLAGSAASVGLVGRERLVGPMIGSMALFGGAVAAVALTIDVPVVAGLLVAAGAGLGLVYLTNATLVQRVSGDDVMSRVFGVHEAVIMLGQSAGGLVAPLLVGVLGIDGALVAAGLAAVGGALVCGRWLTGGPELDVRQAGRLAALGEAQLFMPLSAPVVERLAARATDLVAGPGDIIIREGEVGDAFFVLESGAVEVMVGGTVVGVQRGRGTAFGEIALLRGVPRSATIRAMETVAAVVVERRDFLDALTGQGRSRRLAERVADERWEAAH